MTLPSDLIRVSKADPCPICSRPKWCLQRQDRTAVICARIESRIRCGDLGWLHPLVSARTWRKKQRSFSIGTTNNPDGWARLAAEFGHALDPSKLSQLASGLGVSVASLRRLEIGWNGWAYTFPMRDGRGRLCGIRLRKPDGGKLSITGSKEGLFIPQKTSTLIEGAKWTFDYVCEGPTDTAALLTVGLHAIGRPSCLGGTRELCRYFRRKCRQVVIVADSDKAGQDGASKLEAALLGHAFSVRVIQPPPGARDAREWVRAGATSDDIHRVAEGTAPRNTRTVVSRRAAK